MESKIYLTWRAKRVFELFDQGKVNEAQAFLAREQSKEESSDICCSQDTSDTAFDPIIANVFINLAVIYNDAGHLDAAEILYKEALSIYRRLNKEKPFTHYGLALVATCNLLALLYTETGRKKEAKELYGESLSVCKSLAEFAGDIFEKYIRLIRNSLDEL